MKVNLRPSPWKSGWYEQAHGMRYVNWKLGLPFIHNPRGILVHRLKWARSKLAGDKPEGDTWGYWCGNMAPHCATIHAEPPDGLLVCNRCETLAVAAGEKSSSEIVGRHVCLGELRARKLCCTNEQN